MKNPISILVIWSLSVLLPVTVIAESISVQDTILSDVTWSADTVRITGNVVVWDDVTLTILPGTRVEFQGNYYMYIQGTIIADGTEEDTIVFTPADTAGFWDYATVNGSWQGLLFYNGTGAQGPDGAMIDNDSSRFDHCRLEFTKSTIPEGLAYSAIEVGAFSRLVITNCELRYNHSPYRGGALRIYQGSDIRIENNYIHHNKAYQWGGGIWINNSSPIIAGNIIEYNATITTNQNEEWAAGGGIGVIGMKPVIRNNIIRYNSAITGAGIHLYNSFGLVQDNIISHNSTYTGPPGVNTWGGGIACVKGSSPDIINNFIANNTADEGGGLYLTDSEPTIIGNLIVNNTANITGGAMVSYGASEIFMNNTVAHNKADIAGAIEYSDSDPVFQNNIIWNNPDLGGFQIKMLGYFVRLHIENSIVENGVASIYGESTPTVSGLLEEDPGFGSVSGGRGAGFEGLSADWSVDRTSPCVNNGAVVSPDLPMPGKDLAGDKRIRHSIIDIGAYEVYIPSIAAQDTIKTDQSWIADTVNITGDLVISDDVTLTILPGTWVVLQGRYKISVIGTIRAIGTEAGPIHFTVADTSGNWDRSIPDGSWKGIFIDNETANNVMADNKPSVFRYCNIAYVKSIEGEAFMHSALYINHFSAVTVTKCTFRNNSAVYEPAALYIRKSAIDVTDCSFYNNTSNNGSAIWAEGSDFRIENCEFRGNWAQDRGGAVNTFGGSLTISNCEFIYNACDFVGGAVFMDRTKARINHSFFANNYAGSHGGAIHARYQNLQLVNNVIVNNEGNAGGGVYTLYIDDLLTMNNTICNNRGWNGGGMYTTFSNHTSINDVMYGNDAQTYGKQYAMYSVTSTINFFNTNLEGGTGGIGFWIGQELTGTYRNVIDSLPGFLRPSDGPGVMYDGTGTNWNLRSISPCINNGSLLGQTNLEEFDMSGNPRIYDSLIDIGAYESRYGLPRIQKQPDNYIGCAGDSIELRVQTHVMSYFQWQKDGEDIPGATTNNLLLENISPEDDGNYQCIVSNAFGSIETTPAYLLARAAPEFIRQPEDIWAVEGERTILSCTGTGTPPIGYQWYRNGEPMPRKTYPDLWIQDTGPGDEALYHCEMQNACKTVQSDTVQLYLAPQICMVTVDTATEKNLIVWEKKSTAPIASYNIYRESIVAGEYDWIGNVPAVDLSEYTDLEVNPVEQAYIYKITAVTADENESDMDLCHPHKTIHMLSSVNIESGTAQLDWDHYYGFQYGTFYIYRKILGKESSYSEVKEMASSTTTWIDVNASPEETIYYRVAVKRDELCYSTGSGKAGTAPYQHSLSNLDDNKLKASGMKDYAAGTLKIYPNPFAESATLEFPNADLSEYLVIIRDLSGKTVRLERTSSHRLTIGRGDLAAGIYSIELVGRKIFRDRFVIR